MYETLDVARLDLCDTALNARWIVGVPPISTTAALRPRALVLLPLALLPRALLARPRARDPCPRPLSTALDTEEFVSESLLGFGSSSRRVCRTRLRTASMSWSSFLCWRSDAYWKTSSSMCSSVVFLSFRCSYINQYPVLVTVSLTFRYGWNQVNLS